MGVTVFGMAIRETRQKAKQTLLSMAKIMRVSVAYLSAIETGRNKVPVEFIGIEMHPEYFKLACERVEQFYKGCQKFKLNHI